MRGIIILHSRPSSDYQTRYCWQFPLVIGQSLLDRQCVMVCTWLNCLTKRHRLLVSKTSYKDDLYPNNPFLKGIHSAVSNMELIRVAGRGSGLVLKAQRQINLLNWHHFFLCLTWLQGKKICTALTMFFRKRNNAVNITTTMSGDKYSHQVILYHIFGSLSYFYFLRYYHLQCK